MIERTNVAGFGFRLSFVLPGKDYIAADSEALVLFEDAAGPRVRLRSGARGTPIKQHSAASIVGGPYASADDARRAGESARTGLLFWAIRSRTGVDVADRKPRGAFTNMGLEWVQQQVGGRVRAARPGLDIFEYSDEIAFVALNGDLAVGRGQELFASIIQSALERPSVLSERQVLAGQLYCASYFDLGERSLFLTQMSALEALLEPRRRRSDALGMLRGFQQVVRQSGLDDDTRHAMLGSLKWLEAESIGQAGPRLV